MKRKYHTYLHVFILASSFVIKAVNKYISINIYGLGQNSLAVSQLLPGFP